MVRCITLCLLIPFVALAQPELPEGGVHLIDTTLSSIGYYGKEYGSIGQKFTQDESQIRFLQVDIFNQPPHVYNIALTCKSISEIKAGYKLVFSFEAKAEKSSQETGEATAKVVVEHHKTYDKLMDRTISIGNTWHTYYARAEAKTDLDTKATNVVVQLGFPPQQMLIRNLRLVAYPPETIWSSLPETEITYVGHDPQAKWRETANERIEKIRKGDIHIEIQDSLGKPIPGISASLQMTEHAFGFGTAVAGQRYQDDKRYRDTIHALFNEVVLENDLKWKSWQWDKQKNLTDQVLQRLFNSGTPVRGHVLVWPSFRYNPKFLKEEAEKPAVLRKRISEHISDMVPRYRTYLANWDVINEPVTNTEFMDILGYESMADWINQVRELDPDPKLYVNDYSIVSAGGLDTYHQDSFYNRLLEIEKYGAQIDGIGIQGHFSSQLTPIDRVYQILDRFAALDKEIKITEFDVDLPQRQVQADYTRDFMTIVFSHPAVSSFLMWGFWAGQHWKPNTALFEEDWTPRPNYFAYHDLVFDTWWTPKKEFTTTSSPFEFRGFLGSYTLELLHNNRTYSIPIHTNKPGQRTDITVQPGKETQLIYTVLDSIKVTTSPSVASIQVSGVKESVVRTLYLKNHNGSTLDTYTLSSDTDTAVLSFSYPSGKYILDFVNGSQESVATLVLFKN